MNCTELTIEEQIVDLQKQMIKAGLTDFRPAVAIYVFKLLWDYYGYDTEKKEEEENG